MRIVPGTGRGRIHRSAGHARRPRRAARRLLRKGRLRLCGQGRHGVRHEAAAGIAQAARPTRNSEAAVHEGSGAATIAGTLGATRDRHTSRIYRMDRKRQAASPAPPRRSLRQERTRGDAGTPVITHPDKVMFPDDGITKGDLAAYYQALAPVILPHLKGRPLTMERYPAGIGAKGFWQKDVSKGFPDWLERVEVPKKDGVVHHPMITDVRS